MAAPFGRVGLDDAEQARVDRLPGTRRRRADSRRRRAASARRRRPASIRPSAGRPSVAPRSSRGRTRRAWAPSRRRCARSQPWLTSTISRSPLFSVLATGRSEPRSVSSPKPILILKARWPAARSALDGVEGGAAGIEAGGVDRHRRRRRAPPQCAPQRQAALARAEIVDREVEAGGSGGERAGIAALDAQHMEGAVELAPQRRPDRRATCRARAAPRCRRTAARDARRRHWGNCTRSRPSRARRRNLPRARTPPRARSWCRRRCGQDP